MVARQVGEDAGGEAQVVGAAQRQRVRRHFHHARAAALRAACRAASAAAPALPASCAARRASRAADAVADRADAPALDAGRLEDRGEHVGRGRLAVGAGDADQRQLLARIAVERRGELGQRRARVRHLDPGHGDAGGRRRFRDDGDRAVGDGLRREARAVGVDAAQRDEHRARLHLPRVVGDRPSRRVRVARSLQRHCGPPRRAAAGRAPAERQRAGVAAHERRARPRGSGRRRSRRLTAAPSCRSATAAAARRAR